MPKYNVQRACRHATWLVYFWTARKSEIWERERRCRKTRVQTWV